jgi:Flp pilus assembly protein TadG
MRSKCGQALLELALCAPLVVLLMLGILASVQVASGRGGLESATQAAAEAAARAPDAATALAAARVRFQTMIADYPLRSPRIDVSIGDFDRRGSVTASSSASIDIAWAAILLLPSHMTLQSQVVLRVEPWRSRVP